MALSLLAVACAPKPFATIHDLDGDRVCPADDGGYFLAGSAEIPGDRWRLVIRHTDASGGVAWDHVATAIEDATPRAFGLRQAGDGGVIVWGYFGRVDVGNEAFVTKVSAGGQALWTRTFGGPGVDVAKDLVETARGYAFVGWTDSSGAGEYDVWVAQLDLSGDLLSADTFGGPDDDVAIDVDETTDGGFVVVAQNRSVASTSGQIEVLEFDADGSLLWDVFLGGVGHGAEPFAVAQTADGGAVVSGFESVSDPPYPSRAVGHLYALSASGEVKWSADGPEGQSTYGGPIAVAADGTVVQARAAGQSSGQLSVASLTRYSATGSVVAATSWPLRACSLFCAGRAPRTLVPTADGGFAFLSGVVDDGVEHALAAVKVDAALQREWSIPWSDGPGGVEIGPTLDGWFVLAGDPPLPYEPTSDSWLVRPAPDGTVPPPT